VARCIAATSLPRRESAFIAGSDGRPTNWTTWSARAETAPRCFVDSLHFRSKPGSLAISGNSNIAEQGGWERLVKGIDEGAWYRFAAYYRTEAVLHESSQVLARLDWRDAREQRIAQPDYIYQARRDGAWTRVTLDTQAPAHAAAVTFQLYLSNAPNGTVWWDDISLESIPAPVARKVTVASINFRPQRTASAAENVQRFISTIEDTVRQKTDVILLPEGI